MKEKKWIKQTQDVHDGEHKKKQQTTTKIEKATYGTILREERNSMMEEKFEEPQHLDQLKRVLWHITTEIEKATYGTILREERNSMMEEQFEEPQHLDQSKSFLA